MSQQWPVFTAFPVRDASTCMTRRFSSVQGVTCWMTTAAGVRPCHILLWMVIAHVHHVVLPCHGQLERSVFYTH